MKSKPGFSVVETLLLLVAVGIICSVGWFVYSSSNKANDSLENADKNSGIQPDNQKNNTSEAKNEVYAFKPLGVSMEILPGWSVKETKTHDEEENADFYLWEVTRPGSDGKIDVFTGGFRGGFSGCGGEDSTELSKAVITEIGPTNNQKLIFMTYTYFNGDSNVEMTLLAEAEEQVFYQQNNSTSTKLANNELKTGTYYLCLGEPTPGFALDLRELNLKTSSLRNYIVGTDSERGKPFTKKSMYYPDIKTMLTSTK